MSPCTKGALNELVAAAWLISRGYSVYRNVAPDGPIDMIAHKGDELIKIDVKAASVSIDAGGTERISCKNPTEWQTANGVRFLVVRDGVVLGWREDVYSEIAPDPRTLTNEVILGVFNHPGTPKEAAEAFGVAYCTALEIRGKKRPRYKELLA